MVLEEVDTSAAPKRKLSDPETCPYPSDISHLLDEASIKRQRLESESTLIILNKNGEAVHVKLPDGPPAAAPSDAPAAASGDCAAAQIPEVADPATDENCVSSSADDEDDGEVVEVDPEADTDVEIELETHVDDATFAEMTKNIQPAPN